MTTTPDQSQDLTPAMLEMQAQLAQLQQELASLKQRAQTLPTATTPTLAKPLSTLTGSRRTTLKRLGLALLGGAAAATLTNFSVSEAKVIVNPVLGSGTSTSVAGAIVIPPGAAAPINSPTASGKYYGLIASGSASALDLSTLPPADAGVYATSASYGVYGFSPGGVGVTGYSTSGYGIYGYTSSSNGVYGYSASGKGVAGYSASGFGVSGVSASSYGVYGESSNYRAVYGKSSTNDGVYGESTSGYGISGYSSSNTAINGYSANGYGVSGWSNSSYGVYGFSPNNFAGYFVGNVHVGGTLEKTSGSFKIDHPLDPSNKYLYHSFVESPDMLNIYNGIVTLDDRGEATVEMPDWFEALNSDFRYQLTSLGEFAPVFIAEKLTNRRFKIAGGRASQEVSWQVTGIRQDEWAKAHRIPVEEDKNEKEKGKYLHPELYGQPEEKLVSPRPAQQERGR